MAYRSEDIAALFGRSAPSYDTVIPFFTRFGAALVDLAALQAGESVLDVGSGRGATLLPAVAKVGTGGRILGADLSEEMVTLLDADIARRGLTNASVRRMDAEALDVGPRSFDVVLCSFVLHLLPDPEKAAMGFRRALRPGGRCVASVPSGSGPTWDFLGPLTAAYAQRVSRPMIMPFRASFDLPAALTAGGLAVQQVVDHEVEFHFPDETAWWAWAWSHGMRDLLEALGPADLEAMRSKLFAELGARRTEQGIPLGQHATFVVAVRDGVA